MAANVRWGIIGTGGIAAKFAHDLAQSHTGELVAVGSRTQESADAFGERFGVPRRHGSYEALIADADVDAIYNSLPNHMHVEWTVKCAEAGKHILCEKPLTTNHAEAMTLISAVRQHDVFMMEAFMYRCHPQTAKLVELVRSGRIGEVRLIQSQFSYNMGQKLDNIRLQNEAAGGGIMDVGCYCMSMSRLIAGAALGLDGPAEPEAIQAFAHIGDASRVDEVSSATVRFPGQIFASLNCGTQVQVDRTLRIWGSKGHIEVPNPWFPGMANESATIVINVGGEEETIHAPSDAPLYAVEADALAAHVNARQAPSPCMTWDDSLGNMNALDQWRQAVGLTFDREAPDRLTRPFSGSPLQRRPDHRMRYGRIEGVDKDVSRLVLGSMVMDSRNMPFSCAMLDYFYECGGTCIDTAYVYGGGFVEPAVGKWMQLRDNRDEMVIIGKGGCTIDCTPEMLTRELHETLERFQTDYVDIYLMHRDNLDVPVAEFVDCLNEHKAAGRIRTFGGSNWTPARLDEANAYAATNGLAGFSASSPNFSLAVWNEPMWSDCVTASTPDERQWYTDKQLPLFAWSSQASGFFTGRFAPDDRSNADVVRTWYNDDNFERLRRATELAEQRGVSALQVALAYVLSVPLNLFALVGPRTLEESRTSFAALELSLSEAECRWLNLEE